MEHHLKYIIFFIHNFNVHLKCREKQIRRVKNFYFLFANGAHKFLCKIYHNLMLIYLFLLAIIESYTGKNIQKRHWQTKHVIMHKK